MTDDEGAKIIPLRPRPSHHASSVHPDLPAIITFAFGFYPGCECVEIRAIGRGGPMAAVIMTAGDFGDWVDRVIEFDYERRSGNLR